MTVSIWAQHRARFSCEGHTLHYLRWTDALALLADAGLTDGDLGEMARIRTHMEAGDMSERETLAHLADRFPAKRAWALCVEDLGEADALKWIEQTARTADQQRQLETMLDMLSSPAAATDSLIAAVGTMIAIGVPWVTVDQMTLQQAAVMLQIAQARAEAAAQAVKG